MNQRKLHEEIQDLKDQLKGRDEEVKVSKNWIEPNIFDWKADVVVGEVEVEHVCSKIFAGPHA